MVDIVERLRNWSSPSVSQLDDWILEAADEIERLRSRPETHTGGEGAVWGLVEFFGSIIDDHGICARCGHDHDEACSAPIATTQVPGQDVPCRCPEAERARVMIDELPVEEAPEPSPSVEGQEEVASTEARTAIPSAGGEPSDVEAMRVHGTCGLFHCPLDEARKLMPDLPWHDAPIREGVEYIADVKVHMLMPGQWPCIPNWHQDFVPRDEETLEERHDLLGTGNPPMLLWLSGPPLTEFRDQGITAVPARTWFEFTQFDEHRGVAATEHGWRTFIRLTPVEVMREGLPHQQIPAPRDQWIRKHTQVYLDAENFTW